MTFFAKSVILFYTQRRRRYGEGDLFIAGAAEELQPVEKFVESKKDLDSYIKTIPVATLNCASDSDAAAAFNEYLATDAATAIWEKYGYEIVE